MFERFLTLGEPRLDRLDLDFAVFEGGLFAFAIALGPGASLFLGASEDPLCLEPRFGHGILAVGISLRWPGESRGNEESSPTGDHHGQRHRHCDGCC